jgi:protein-glutamine gamma-glutamyltransferase
LSNNGRLAEMSSRPSQSVGEPLSQSINYYFETSLYLLVATGFVTLASTGGLDVPSMILTATALSVRGYLLLTRQKAVIPERWTTPLTLAYFVFFAIDYFVVSRGFLPATVHLALFGVVVRMFSLRRERDHVMLAILAFLMVLASAVLTVDSLFLACFSLFMLMAVSTFVLMEMRRSGQAASIQAGHSSNPGANRNFASSLTRVAGALMLMILAGTAALFFLLPRKPSGYFGGYSFGTDYSSGFSDRVQLGQIGQIQQSNAVVMHIQIDDDTQGRYDLHWRGVALEDFDGFTWSRSREQYILQRWPDNSFEIPRIQDTSPPYSARSQRQVIHYRVLMEPIGTNIFFLAPWARSVKGGYRLLAGDSGGAVYNFDPQHAINRYEADSDISAPTPAELRAATGGIPASIATACLRVPMLDPRLPRLAAEVTRRSRNNYEKATAIENYLRTRFGYTLELPRTVPKDPIANFLFERKRGHCEYFASSMAIMLRTLGIPSRVVNGFRSDEFNDVTGNYVVRAKDAHSWVEAYFPGYGWQTFDPTPGASATTPQGWARVGLYVDAMASFWRDWVVSYDTSHQYVLGQVAIHGTRGLWEKSRTWAHHRYDAMLRWARHSHARIEHAPGRWSGIGLILGIIAITLGNLSHILRWLSERRLQLHPERSPELAAALWYKRMVRVLEPVGVSKSPAQTPQEFVESIPDTHVRGKVAHFTAIYESVRFGGSSDDARSLEDLYEEVESAARK